MKREDLNMYVREARWKVQGFPLVTGREADLVDIISFNPHKSPLTEGQPSFTGEL